MGVCTVAATVTAATSAAASAAVAAQAPAGANSFDRLEDPIVAGAVIATGGLLSSAVADGLVSASRFPSTDTVIVDACGRRPNNDPAATADSSPGLVAPVTPRPAGEELVNPATVM